MTYTGPSWWVRVNDGERPLGTDLSRVTWTATDPDQTKTPSDPNNLPTQPDYDPDDPPADAPVEPSEDEE